MEMLIVGRGRLIALLFAREHPRHLRRGADARRRMAYSQAVEDVGHLACDRVSCPTVRPIWQREAEPPRGGGEEFDALADAESNASKSLRVAVAAAESFSIDASIIEPIVQAAEIDLAVGCDLARAGYFKQAYTVWRCWFEETMFALYFLEAPLHRTAWQVVDEIVKPGDRPNAELMLHQLLDASKKHPFHLVYTERFGAVFADLKRSFSKNEHPLKQAEQCLTDLSQGVHGTYLPPRLSREQDLPAALKKHGVPVLRRTDSVVAAFCFAFVHSLTGLSEQQLLALRGVDYEPNEEDHVLYYALQGMDRWIAEQKKEPRRG